MELSGESATRKYSFRTKVWFFHLFRLKILRCKKIGAIGAKNSSHLFFSFISYLLNLRFSSSQPSRGSNTRGRLKTSGSAFCKTATKSGAPRFPWAAAAATGAWYWSVDRTVEVSSTSGPSPWWWRRERGRTSPTPPSTPLLLPKLCLTKCITVESGSFPSFEKVRKAKVYYLQGS